MTDNAERQVREWAKGRNGDPLTPKDIVDLVLAVDADGDARHVETIQRLDDVDERHITLCLRVSELEQVSVGCSERVKAFVAAEHDSRHTEHMSNHHGSPQKGLSPLGRDYADPSDAQFGEKRESAFTEDEEMGDLRRAWRFGKWFVVAFGLIFIDMFARYLSHTLFGYPS